MIGSLILDATTVAIQDFHHRQRATVNRKLVGDLQRRLLTAMASRAWPVTFSIGVASCQRAPVDFDALMAEADTVMYEVKHGGRNRVLQKEL